MISSLEDRCGTRLERSGVEQSRLYWTRINYTRLDWILDGTTTRLDRTGMKNRLDYQWTLLDTRLPLD